MGDPDRTVGVRQRQEPRARLALSGWYDPDSVSFEAPAHEVARTAIRTPRRERDARVTIGER